MLVAFQPVGVAEIRDELEVGTVEVPERFNFQTGALLRAVQRLMACFEAADQPVMKARELELILIRSLIGECGNARDGNHRLSKVRLEAVQNFIRSPFVSDHTG